MRISRVLIAVDFSDTATNAAQWATQHFAPQAEVMLLHVIELPHRPRFGHDSLPPDSEIIDLARQNAEAKMAALRTLLGKPSVRSEVRVGKPHEQVAIASVEFGADVVVIGPHGERPRPSRFLGTTADRVARTSPVPVLIATRPPAGAPRRILVPVEDCPVTSVLLSWSSDLAADFNAQITLLHVWSNTIYSHVASLCYADAQNEAEAKVEIEAELERVAAGWVSEAEKVGIPRERLSAITKYGKAGDIAAATACDIRAELIVVGRRGSGLVAPALLGSTVATILHEARCPVLVIAEPRT